MDSSLRIESLIVLVQRGQAHTYNARKWSEWGHPLPVAMCEPDELLTVLEVKKEEGFNYIWIADSSYEPLPTGFRNYLVKKVWKNSVFTIFKVGRPTFIRAFYAEKFTASHDPHDKYGGLRYMQIDAALTEMDYDTTCGGSEIDYLEIQASRHSFPYSVFQLSAEESQLVVVSGFESIRRFYPSVSNHYSETTILEAHRQLALKSDSNMFIVIDADCILTDGLGIESFQKWDEDYVHVWYVKNPINGLIYGHGGPKAFHKGAFLELEDETVDVTTSANRKQMIVHKEVVGVHRFNWSEEATWRTAFREAAKLSWIVESEQEGAHEAAERLTIWLNEELVDEDQPYWEECLDGAKCGNDWAILASTAQEKVKINDFAWLHEQYEQYMLEVETQVKEAEDEDEDAAGDEDDGLDFDDDDEDDDDGDGDGDEKVN
jgi:hypothetical protein